MSVAIANLITSYGMAGTVVAGLGGIVCVIASIGFGFRLLRLLAAGRAIADEQIDYASIVTLVLVTLALIGVGLILLSGTLAAVSQDAAWLVAYVVVFLAGGSVGAAELISRYRDKPTRAISTAPAVFYVIINAGGSCIALYLIYVFRVKLGFADPQGGWSPEPGMLVQAVLIAGFSSLLFFRTSLFKLRVGDSDLAVGPSIVLDALLGAADRAVDRVMAEPRAQFVHAVMGDVAFEKAIAILPAHCLALMQNVSGEETQRIVGVVNALRADKDMPDKIKTLNIGLALLTVVGEEVLRTAVKGLEADLQDTTSKLLPQVAEIMHGVSFNHARSMLPSYCFALYSKIVPSDQQEKLAAETKMLAELNDVPEDYKATLLGIKLVRMTDGATLKKAVQDLGPSIKVSPKLLASPDAPPTPSLPQAAKEAEPKPVAPPPQSNATPEPAPAANDVVDGGKPAAAGDSADAEMPPAADDPADAETPAAANDAADAEMPPPQTRAQDGPGLSP